MKLIIQKTTGLENTIPEAEIIDIRELILELDSGLDEGLDYDEEYEEEEEAEFPENDEVDFDEEELEEEIMISENDNEYLIELNAPGFHKEDFVIEVSDDILSINAKQETGLVTADPAVAMRENTFNRLFRLPENTDSDEIEAHYENEVLTVSIGKG